VRQLEDRTLEVTVKPIRPIQGGTFPYKGNDPQVLAALKPNAFLQSEDKTIVQLARQAIGDANDAAEAVRRIEAFVAGHVRNKDLSVGYASAAEVASTRQGDCTEHALLAAALCRAVGIPAKVVTGLAYVQEFGGVKNCFGGHAWTAAYVGGQWIGLDAAFKGTGRGGYDAGHIALAVGDGEPGDFFGLATTLGRFTIEKVTAIRQ
jgi:transglutaminase-like putative cysteine protease